MLFEGKIKVEKENRKGEIKYVSEQYIIKDEELFANAEYKLMELCNGNCEVTHIVKSKIREIINEKEEEKPFFKAIIVDIFVNDDGTEKEMQYPVLVCASDMKEANKLIEDYLKQGLNDMRLKEIKETKILDIL